MTNLIPRLSEVIDADLIAQGKGLDGIDAEMIASSVLDCVCDSLDEEGYREASIFLLVRAGKIS